MGREEFKWRHHTLWSKQGPHFSPHSTAKTNTFVSSGISDVAITSVHSEKTCMKKLMVKIINIIIIIIIIMNKSQETKVYSSCQKLTCSMKLRPEKC